MEAQIIAEVGTWKNFDDIEECLILDELMLLIDALNKKHKSHFRMLAAAQGLEIPDDDEDSSGAMDDNDLPPEVIEAEREHQKKKQEALVNQGSRTILSNDDGIGLGYESVTNNILDQSVL